MKAILSCSLFLLFAWSSNANSAAELAAAEIDREIAAAEQQVQQLKTQFSAALDQEGKTVEKLLAPGADPDAISAELQEIRVRADKLKEGLNLAEDHVAALKKGRQKRIDAKVAAERQKLKAQSEAEARRQVELAAQRQREEAVAAERRKVQEEKVP